MAMTLTGSGTGTVGVPNSATAQNSTSGTSIDFTGIPAGIKRITVLFAGVSTNGSSDIIVQIGSGSVATTGYACSSSVTATGVASGTYSTGFGFFQNGATSSYVYSGALTLYLLNASNNTWTASGLVGVTTPEARISTVVGSKALSGTLDRVRITTVNGTDAFDAGSVNIIYE